MLLYITQLRMSKEFEILQCHEEELVEALFNIDIPMLSRNLQRYRVITKEMTKTIASLDHDRLDSQTTVRYLLHLVCDRIKVDTTLCDIFLKVLCRTHRKGVVETLVQQLHTMREGPEVSADRANKRLVEEDVGDLIEILAEVSYKWEEISISLKLPIASIEECRNASNNKLRLHKALTEWVCGNHKHAKPPTLTDLRDTLASNTVARKLEMKMACTSCASEKSQNLDVSLRIQRESIDTEVADGKSTLLEVQVCPRESVTYRWMKDEQPLSESSDFSGTCSAILLINQARWGTEGEYCCLVSHASEQFTSSNVTVTVIYPPEKKCLLNLYQTQSEIPQDSWFSANTFISLALVKVNKLQTHDNLFVEGEIDAILEKRKRVEYKDAFGKYEIGALVLVEGRPGSGKTTLAHKIAKDWANGTVLQNSCMVFHISLRNYQEKLEIFKPFFQSQSELFQKKLEETSGDRVCFVLDGYDEYGPRHRDKSVINQLIQKTYLPLAMIIVTSRPAASAALRPKATRRVEVLGFTNQQFKNFISSYPFENFICSDEVDQTKSKLLTFLKAYTNVLNMCYLPINACMICFLYSQNLGDNMPKTETKIYESFVIAIISRKLRLNNSSVNLCSLKELHGYSKICFRLICALAFNMTAECKQIVHDHELPVSLDSLNSTAMRDLLTVDRTYVLFGFKDIFTFLHLTLQEYLAAYHIAGLNDIQQMRIIRSHESKSYMLNTFKFYCGLVDMKHKISQFDKITNYSVPDPLYMCHCAHETQEETVCCRAVTLLKGEIKVGVGVLTPADFTVLSYVISMASSLVIRVEFLRLLLYEDYVDDKWKNRELDNTNPLTYSFETTFVGTIFSMKMCIEDLLCTHVSYNYKPQHKQVQDKLNELFRESLPIDIQGQTLPMKQFWECSCDIFSSDSASPLADALKQCTNLKFLQLLGNYKSIEAASVIARTLKNCVDLQEVKISGVMPSSSAVVLVGGIQHLKLLHTLVLMNIELCSDCSAVLARGLKHCSNLKNLHLTYCKISPEGAEAISNGLTTILLKIIDMQYNSIGYKGTLALANKCHFKKLNINGNSIGSNGTEALARGALNYSTLYELHLENNNIDSSGIIALAKEISCFAGLKCLCLSHNYIGSDGAAALAQGLKFCIYLQILLFQNCDLSIDGVVEVGNSFNCWKDLTILDLSSNLSIITMDDTAATLIARRLQFLTFLEQLYLSNNSINSSSAIALAEGLQCCPFLHTLDMSKNTIGSAGAEALAGGLKCKEMKRVNLSHNNINNESVEALAILIQSSRLLKLDLSQNNIGSTGALILITELISYDYPTRLNLLINNISPKATKFLNKMVRRNTNLRVLLSNTSQAS